MKLQLILALSLLSGAALSAEERYYIRYSVTTGVQKDIEVEHDFETIGLKIMHLNARKFYEENSHDLKQS